MSLVDGRSTATATDFVLNSEWPLAFTRQYASNGGHPGVMRAWPAPYGSYVGEAPQTHTRALWVHSLLGVVTSSPDGGAWTALPPGGFSTTFRACDAGATGCWAAVAPTSLEGDARLFRAPDGGFTLFEEKRRYHFRRFPVAPDGLERAFVTAIEDDEYPTSGRRVLANFAYAAPDAGSCYGSSTGAFLSQATTIEGSRLTFHYGLRSNSVRNTECVLTRVSLDHISGGVGSQNVVNYTYQSGSSGRIATATYPLTSDEESYSYPDSGVGDFEVKRLGSVMVRHVTQRDAGVVQSFVNRGGVLALELSRAPCPALTSCRYTDETVPRGDGTGTVFGMDAGVDVLSVAYGEFVRVSKETDVDYSSREWAVQAVSNSRAAPTGLRNERGYWANFGLQAATNGAVIASHPTLPLEVTSVVEGATTLGGTGARQSAFTYTYLGSGQTPVGHEQRLATRNEASPTGSLTTRYSYNSSTNALVAERKGPGATTAYSSGTWTSSVTRRLATFYRRTPTEGCGGSDSLQRPVEIEGPCWVDSDSATSCISGQRAPFRVLEYYPSTTAGPDRNRLRLLRRYPNHISGSGVCGKELRTEYSNYDVFGQPRTVKESLPGTTADVATTEYGYVAGRMTSMKVLGTSSGDLEWTYTYDGPSLASVRSPEGNYEVYCHRSTSGGFCDNTTAYSSEVQGVFRSGAINGLHFSSLRRLFWGGDGRLKQASEYSPDGERRRRVFDHDYRGNLSYEAPGTTTRFSARLYDGLRNVVGLAPAHSGPPLDCDGRTLAGLPYSPLCTALTYDAVDRLKEMATPDGLRVCIDYDAAGNPSTVKSGCTTSCAACSNAPLSYSFDDFGNLLDVTLPAPSAAGVSMQFAYDATGNVIARRSRQMTSDGTTLTFDYDGLGRQLGASHVETTGGTTVTPLYVLEYDSTTLPRPAGCPTQRHAQGRLATRMDSYGTTAFSYDSAGRLLEESRARAGSASCQDSSLYTYTPNGNRQTVKVGPGRVFSYAYRQYDGGVTTDELLSVSAYTYDAGWPTLAGGQRLLLDDIRQEPWGDIRSYETLHHGVTPVARTRVEYRHGASTANLPDNCTAGPGTSDLTGRYRLLEVTSLGEGAETIFRQYLSYAGEQLTSQNECLLNDPLPRTLVYGFSDAGTNAALAGASFSGRTTYLSAQYTLDQSGERQRRMVRLPAQTYPPTGFMYQDVGANIVATRTLGAWPGGPLPPGAIRWTRRTTFDLDGRLVRENPFPGATVGREFSPGLAPGTAAGSGLDSVVRSVATKGGTYQYFYDALNRRWAKVYPINGVRDEYYYSHDSSQLWSDVGPDDDYLPTHFTQDDYAWIAGRPLVAVRGRKSLSGNWEADGQPQCDRLSGGGWQGGHAAIPGSKLRACGAFFLVTDYHGKPVLALDDSRKVAGTGEYEPFGQVNRVEMLGAYHTYPVPSDGGWPSWPEPTIQAPILRVRAVEWAASRTRVRNRLHFADVDVSDVNGTVGFYDEARPSCGGPGLSPEYCDAQISQSCLGTPGCTSNREDVWSGWYETEYYTDAGAFAYTNVFGSLGLGGSADCRGHLAGVTPPNARCRGAVVDGLEYRRYESGAKTFWPPLRLPGQYYDEETGLHENWNRFYDSSAGRYLAPEPLLQDPSWVAAEARQGHTALTYGYARNNPLQNTDPTGKNPAAVLGGAFVCGPVCAAVAGAGAVGAAALLAYLAAKMPWTRPTTATKAPTDERVLTCDVRKKPDERCLALELMCYELCYRNGGLRFMCQTACAICRDACEDENPMAGEICGSAMAGNPSR